ncbi:MAG: alpha/beta hydrolase [Vicinamibacterales bacterium]|jgi:acetyl esterase/lipase|nr:alpha/beta hydrolase [Vicinamibacterales bacterium]MDP7691370.1 alpha/beta hydrolase [Vicinamibacterales bacterium]
MRPQLRRSLDLLRLLGGVVLLSLGLVAVLPAANDHIWQLSVLVTEGGHWALPASLPLFAPGWSRSRAGVGGALLGLLGTLLLLTPLGYAVSVSRELPAALETRFANQELLSPNAISRPAPLVARDLFVGVSSSPVRVEEHLFASVGGQELRLDLYRPATQRDDDSRPLPVVVVIHGGSWQNGSRKDFPALNRYLASRGYLVAAVSYRLAPQFRYPAARDDVAAAIVFLKGNAGRLGLDARRLALLGPSAGGQLALIAAYTLRDPAIKGVVSYYGPVALRWGYANPAKRSIIDSSGVLDAYLGGSPDVFGAQYDAASPLSHVGHRTPPTLLINGLRDELVSPFHGEFLSDRLMRSKVPHLYLRLPWAVHGCDYLFNGPCGQITTYAVERFLSEVL